MKIAQRIRRQKGFTLIETLMSMAILVFGILSLSSFFTSGLQSSAINQVEFIAQQKAQESLESIFTARDTHTLSWASINNVSQGGVFLDGKQPMLAPGPDGIVGTADDDSANPDNIVIGPGSDKILGTADDQIINLNPWMTRTIAITPVSGATNQNLKQIIVTVTYTYQGRSSSFTLTTYISSYA